MFSNGVIVFAFRLRQLDPSRAVGGVFTPSPLGFAMKSSASDYSDSFSLAGEGSSAVPRSPSGGMVRAAGLRGSQPSALGPSAAAAAASAHSSSSGGLPRNPSAANFTFDRQSLALDGLRERRSQYYVSGPSAPSLVERMRDLVRDVALHFVLPRTSLTPLLSQGLLSAQEVRESSTARHWSGRPRVISPTYIGVVKLC